MAQVQLRDQNGNGIKLLNIRYSWKGESSDQAFFDVFTDYAGNSGWPIPGNSSDPALYTFWINTTNVNEEYVGAGYNPADYVVDQNPNGDFNIRIAIPKAPKTLSRLHVEGFDLKDVYGNRVFIKGVTDFLLYKKYLDGENIDPLLAERAFYGANCVRVIGMVSSFSHWFPQEYGERYYSALPGFLQKCQSYGLYVYFTVFADTQIVMPEKSQQVNHWSRMLPILQEQPNVLIELVNEPYAHDNATDDPYAFVRPWMNPASSGSYDDRLGNAIRPGPQWDFHDFHTPRDGHKPDGFKYCADQVVNAHPHYKYLDQPILSGEPQKFADQSDPTRGGSTLWHPDDARRMAGSSRGTALGIFFHTPGGVFSRPWNDVEKSCAEAWFRELK